MSLSEAKKIKDRLVDGDEIETIEVESYNVANEILEAAIKFKVKARLEKYFSITLLILTLAGLIDIFYNRKKSHRLIISILFIISFCGCSKRIRYDKEIQIESNASFRIRISESFQGSVVSISINGKQVLTDYPVVRDANGFSDILIEEDMGKWPWFYCESIKW